LKNIDRDWGKRKPLVRNDRTMGKGKTLILDNPDRLGRQPLSLKPDTSGGSRHLLSSMVGNGFEKPIL